MLLTPDPHKEKEKKMYTGTNMHILLSPTLFVVFRNNGRNSARLLLGYMNLKLYKSML